MFLNTLVIDKGANNKSVCNSSCKEDLDTSLERVVVLDTIVVEDSRYIVEGNANRDKGEAKE